MKIVDVKPDLSILLFKKFEEEIELKIQKMFYVPINLLKRENKDDINRERN